MANITSRLTLSIAHLPFDRTFPSKYPQYLTKEDLARGYSEWADRFGIVYHARFDPLQNDADLHLRTFGFQQPW